MTRPRSLCLGAAAALALVLAGPARAAEPKKAPPPAPSAEQRQKMAEVHQKMAECLRSDRPIAECPGMMGEGMGSGHMMQGPGPTETPKK